ncbi:unnamed protein product [Prorocentrum cordatum]|uniref:Uncharacterized protein n=1 Tax=Prorocentrum cordatum TaxID=2364126 RepID=A0ABN9T3V8_9DINO|nr:unnamed protein product [Polarella glacialis]
MHICMHVHTSRSTSRGPRPGVASASTPPSPMAHVQVGGRQGHTCTQAHGRCTPPSWPGQEGGMHRPWAQDGPGQDWCRCVPGVLLADAAPRASEDVPASVLIFFLLQRLPEPPGEASATSILVRRPRPRQRCGRAAVCT